MGVRTINLDPASLIDELLGNREGSTVRQPIAALGQQLVASGPVAERIAQVEGGSLDASALIPLNDRLNALEEGTDALAATDADLDLRISGLEAEGTIGFQFAAGGPVAVATTANITLSGEQTIDGVVTNISRILVKDQTAPEENGVYVTASGGWTRATDMDAASKVRATAVFVVGGTVNRGKTFITYSEVTALETDSIAFIEGPESNGLQPQIDALGARADTSEGALYDTKETLLRAFVSDDAEVMERGNYLAVASTINAALKGWRSPFRHNGSVFDAVQLYLRAAATDTPYIVKILDATLTNEIARGYGTVGTTAALQTVILDKVVRSLADEDIAYISYEPAELGGVLSYPADAGVNNYPASDADPSIYREYYLNSSGIWALAVPTGYYCIQFRALSLAGSVAAGVIPGSQAAANLALLIATGGAEVRYDLPGHTDHDATYSNAGLGTQMPAQPAEISFNKITVWGGADGPGKLRGYLVDPSTPGAHVPSATDTLLFEVDIDWTIDVLPRETFLPTIYVVPPGKMLHPLWVSDTPSAVSIARWSTNPGGLPLMRLCLSGAGDEAGIWSNSWVSSSPGYWTVPPKLELAAATSESGGSASVEPYFTIPEVVNAVVGTECVLQYDGICSAHSVGLTGLVGYSCAIVGPKGRNEERFWRFTPVSGDVGDHAFTAKLWDAAGRAVATSSFTVRVHAATAPGSAKNILTIGDSLTVPGTITATMQANFNALGATVPTFVGSQGVAPANHEGYGGRTFAYFASAATNVYRVTVSGVSAVSIGAVYSTGGVNYTVSEVNLVGGVGNLLLSGASAPASSGTLTYVSGTGDTTISYSAMATENTNPFWNPATSQLDIANYRTNKSIAAVIDVVTMQLGINDVFGEGGKTDAQLATITGYALALIDAFLADNASCQIVIVLPSLGGNTSDGYANNYGASYSREVYEATMFRFRKALLAAFDNGAYHANVKVGSGGLSIDRYYGYGRTSSAVSSRITDTVDKHNNGVHPITVGYRQIGDATFADVMAVL